MFDAIINNRIDTGDMRFEVEYHDIEELNRNALSATADITKISCAMLPSIAPQYTLLESGAALGRGNGPLLVRGKGSTEPLRHIAVPGVHTTANKLLEKLFPNQYTTTPLLFSQIAAAVESGLYDGGVLIHEGRFLYHEHNLELVCDLGQIWEERYDIPLPLGAIAMRRELEPNLKSQFTTLLRRSIEYAQQNPSQSRDYIKSHAQEMDDNTIDKHITLFVNDFSLELGTQGHEAIERLTGD